MHKVTATMNSRALIGITCGEIYNKDEAWSPVTFGQSRTYVDAVIAAGGVPVLLPLSSDTAALEALCDLVDGVLFAGGNDLTPSLYGQEPYPTADPGDYSALRDTAEHTILKRTLAARKPVLGICRGMQLLNVHFGGSLYQDIATDVPESIDHNASTKQKTLVDLSHELRIAEGSGLATILQGTRIGTNAHHHQAISQTGEGITATAWAADGIVEAIELADYPYAIGIQAHPESLTHVEPRWQHLFSSFVDAARRS